MPLSRYSRNLLMDRLFTGKLFMSAHSGPCGLDGANEVSGSAYKRGAVEGAFGPAADGAKVNKADASIPWLPKCVVTEVGFWDAPTGGNFIWSVPLGSAKAFDEGDALKFEPNKLILMLR